MPMTPAAAKKYKPRRPDVTIDDVVTPETRAKRKEMMEAAADEAAGAAATTAARRAAARCPVTTWLAMVSTARSKASVRLVMVWARAGASDTAVVPGSAVSVASIVAESAATSASSPGSPLAVGVAVASAGGVVRGGVVLPVAPVVACSTVSV